MLYANILASLKHSHVRIYDALYCILYQILPEQLDTGGDASFPTHISKERVIASLPADAQKL